MVYADLGSRTGKYFDPETDNAMEKQGRHIRIMFVDNDPLVRDSLKTYFHRCPGRSLFFKTGSDGLNSLKHHPADIVVSDYFLPDMDGIAFLNQVNQIHTRAVRILTATLGDEALAARCRQNGIDRFIEKPLNGKALDEVIDQFMRQPFGD